jgi:hypothetical protein
MGFTLSEAASSTPSNAFLKAASVVLDFVIDSDFWCGLEGLESGFSADSTASLPLRSSFPSLLDEVVENVEPIVRQVWSPGRSDNWVERARLDKHDEQI